MPEQSVKGNKGKIDFDFTVKRGDTDEFYIDSDVEAAFRKTGKDCITRKQLAHLGQVYRSEGGHMLLNEFVGFNVRGEADLEKVFALATQKKIDLTKFLSDFRLSGYAERRGRFNLD